MYQITIQGDLARTQSAWFGNAQITSNSEGTTTILLTVADQSALHGVLSRIRDLGLVLLHVDVLSNENERG